MNKRDTEYLLTKISAVDNRIVTEQTIDSWHDVIGHMAYDVAELALVKARQDPQVNWLEPRHVVAKGRDAVMELNERARALAREAEETGKADPEPVCEAHRRRITSCLECCRRLSREAGHLSGDRLHAWAVANVYVSEPF